MKKFNITFDDCLMFRKKAKKWGYYKVDHYFDYLISQVRRLKNQLKGKEV
jgi:hypothetical protein